MDVLLRESCFGRILNYASNDRFFASILEVYKNQETEEHLSSVNTPDVILVDFTGPDDAGIPRNWPLWVKLVAMVELFSLWCACGRTELRESRG